MHLVYFQKEETRIRKGNYRSRFRVEIKLSLIVTRNGDEIKNSKAMGERI